MIKSYKRHTYIHTWWSVSSLDSFEFFFIATDKERSVSLRILSTKNSWFLSAAESFSSISLRRFSSSRYRHFSRSADMELSRRVINLCMYVRMHACIIVCTYVCIYIRKHVVNAKKIIKYLWSIAFIFEFSDFSFDSEETTTDHYISGLIAYIDRYKYTYIHTYKLYIYTYIHTYTYINTLL